MKSIVILYLMLFVGLMPVFGQISLGLEGGFNITGMHYKDPSGHATNGDLRQLNELFAGLLINIPLYDRWYLLTTIRYVTKGAKLSPGAIPQDDSVESTHKLQLHYLELPLNLTYKFPLSFGKLTFGAGPYAAYAVGGSNYLNVFLNGNVVAQKEYAIAFARSNKGIYPGTSLRRWDAGGQVALGLELNNLLVLGINYSQGLFNLDRSDNSRIWNRSAGISLGILLNREDY